MREIRRTEAGKVALLIASRERSRAEIRSLTGDARARHLTVIPGQEMTYQEKERQARAFMAADPEPNGAEMGFRFIFDEVGITAPTPREVAQVILNLAFIFREYIGPVIERSRLKAIAAIDAASSEEELATAVETARAELERI